MKTKDYGCDPIDNGKMFKMVPSGDIVTRSEKEERLNHIRKPQVSNDCFGLSWNQIAMIQGGKQTLDITREK